MYQGPPNFMLAISNTLKHLFFSANSLHLLRTKIFRFRFFTTTSDAFVWKINKTPQKFQSEFYAIKKSSRTTCPVVVVVGNEPPLTLYYFLRYLLIINYVVVRTCMQYFWRAYKTYAHAHMTRKNGQSALSPDGVYKKHKTTQ